MVTTEVDIKEANSIQRFLDSSTLNEKSREYWIEHTAQILRCDLSDCNKPLRWSGNCKLDPGHRGRHAQYGVFRCDNCGKKRRGYPTTNNEYNTICFMCERGLIK